jgi:hypothetical protein
VVLGGEVLGKPLDAADARRMLRALSGTRHEVLTAVCVRRGAIRANRTDGATRPRAEGDRTRGRPTARGPTSCRRSRHGGWRRGPSPPRLR